MLDGSRRGDSKGDAISFNCILGKNMLYPEGTWKGEASELEFHVGKDDKQSDLCRCC